MRVGVVSTQSPFIVGGAERHAANLVTALKDRGHEACEITLPFKPFPGRLLVDSLVAAKLTDLTHLGYPVDLVIGLKFPAYLLRHDRKVYWVLHQHRQVYDMWESRISELLHDPDGAAVRELIRAEDRAAFTAPGARVFANSRNVAGRMQRYIGVASTPLYHPPPNADRLRAGAYGDYLFAPSRLGPHKRQTLMIEALAHCSSAVRLVIAGPPDAPGYLEQLRSLARARGVEDRVSILGAIDDQTMIRHYAECRAVVFVPVDEDYGYITLEAMLAERPVITVHDAGGPLEFIRDGVEGLVTDPDPVALGAAFERVMADRAAAEAMGIAGRATFDAKGISWDTVVETLTADQPTDPAEAAAPDEQDGTGDAPLSVAPPARLTAIQPLPPDQVAALAAVIAPQMPERAPFATLDAALGAYAFGSFPGDWETKMRLHRPYFESHWRRLMATLAAIDDVPATRILDVGIVPPFVFQAMLATLRPGVEIDGIWSEERPFTQTLEPLARDASEVSITLHPADVERDALPLPDHGCDLVLAMEILEHLALDPMHFLAEANRVLAPGGHLLITTPNMASHRNALKALNGTSPYSFGLFVPVGGVHGRHNREYVPDEIARMGEAAGFETVRLATADVYETRIDPEIAAILTARGDDFRLRGETIFWLGRNMRAPGAAPDALYHGRPEQLAGRLSLGARGPAATVTLRVENTSRAVWQISGPFAVSLWLGWSDARGRIVHQGASLALPDPLAPGETVEIALELDARSRPDDGTLEIELFEEGAGRFTGAGRSNAVRLRCSEAGFLRLAEAG